MRKTVTHYGSYLFIAGALLWGPARAAPPSQVIVDDWRTDSNGTVSVTFDGSVWQRIPPPTKRPLRAIYEATRGLWAVTLDDGRIAYVEGRSFLGVEGAIPCERDANSTSEPLETKNFGRCAQ